MACDSFDGNMRIAVALAPSYGAAVEVEVVVASAMHDDDTVKDQTYNDDVLLPLPHVACD